MVELAKNLLFVCTGNTCRSSMAEALMNDMLKSAGEKLKGVKVRSAGISAVPGDPASPQAVEVMKEHGIDISGHRATRLNSEMVKQADVILVMTSAHRDAVLKAHPEAAGRVHLLKEFAGITDDGNLDISDPFGMPVEVYRKTARELKAALEKILEKLGG